MEGSEAAVSQDTGSAPVESTSSPSSGAETAASSSPAQSQSPAAAREPSQRSYSQQDVEGIIRARLEQANKSWEKKLAAMEERQKAGARAFAETAGILPKEQPQAPKFVSEQDFQQHLNSLEQKLEAKHQERILYAKVESDWSAVQKAHPDYANLPGFQAAYLKAWGDNPAGGPELAKELVKAYDDFFAKRQTEYAQKKSEAGGVTVVPAGQGAAATPSGKGKVKLEDRIKAALAR